MEPRTTRSGKTFRPPTMNNNTNKNRKNRNKTAKRRKILNNLVSRPYTPPTISSTNIRGALNFIQYLKGLPIYAIHAHSIVRGEQKMKTMKQPSFFELPKDTFIMSLTTPGEFMCSNAVTTVRVNHLKEEFRKYLHMHSQGNILDERMNLKHPAFFEGIKRAGTGSLYPNIVYGFKEYKPNTNGEFQPAKVNVNGVYDLTDTKLPTYASHSWFYNNRSLINQDEVEGDPDYFLKDVITTVYERTGLSKGIFILMGCLVNKDQDAMRKAGVAMDIANAEYPTRFETVTMDELMPHLPDEIPKERGSGSMIQFHPLSPEMAINMVKSGLYNKTNTSEWSEQVSQTNHNELYRRLKNTEVDEL